MKRCILLIALLGTCVGALEITALGGGNYQKWHFNGCYGKGVGAHGGILASIEMTPSCLPVYVGVESGVLVQKANYTWPDQLARYPPNDVTDHLNNLLVLILLKGTFKPLSGLRLGAGIGPSIIRNISGTWEDTYGGEGKIEKERLQTDLGWQIKGDIGIKLLPMLWLKPSVTAQFNLTADDKETDEKEKETAWFFSLGLALKI